MINILYKDKDILVCVKPAGVVSTDEEGGMPALLREALGEKNADVRTVHRLDMIVGGLMVYARSQEAAAGLSRQITDKSFSKDYLAVVHGRPEADEGRMDDLLFRNAAENKTYVVKRMRKGVRDAALEYKVISCKDELSLVRIHLLTGRTHQIRAQFSSRAMPLVGDRKYGAPDDGCDIALWSCELKFAHPRTKKAMAFSLEPTGGYPWSEFGYTGKAIPSVRDKAILERPACADSKKNPENAKASNISAKPADGSTAPLCPYAKKCGGCQMQNIPYDQQLRTKEKRIAALLSGFGKPEKIIGMADPYHYRNKVHTALGLDGKGRMTAGIYQAASHKIVPVKNCLIEDEVASAITADIIGMLPAFKITAYDEVRGNGFLRHVLVKRGYHTGDVMVVLVVTSPIFKLQKPFITELTKKHPEITTIVLNINDAYGPVVLGRQEKVIYGSGYIEDILCGYRFRISARSFYQINPVQTEMLYSTAIEFASLTGRETVLDAYCGTGTIGISASAKCAQVIGVEINKDAVHDAIANAKANHISNVWFHCADAGEFMQSMAKDKQKCDVVFMDPPRSGSDEKFLTSLLKLAPEKIVYISCGPESLARDLKVLTAGPYRVVRIRPVDMFPHTEHVETVVLMSRVKE